MIADDLLELNRRTAFALWNVGSLTNPPKGLSPRLIFPGYRSGTTRVSEQEARWLWCSTLSETSYYYALEVPTEEKYQQKGEKPISGRSDVSIYDLDQYKLVKIANIEFKEGNVDIESLRKDFEKLMREKIQGNWFHVLESENSGTIKILFEKCVDAFHQNKNHNVELIDIIFSFCILSKKRIISHRFQYDTSKGKFEDYVSAFFSSTLDWVELKG